MRPASIAVAIDVIHALLMAAWVLGLPLLFYRNRPRLRLAYGVYAVGFVVLSRLSFAWLGECFLTAFARRFSAAGAAAARDTNEWFTVRFARMVFGMAPSHRAIAWVSEGLVLVTALGVIVSTLRGRGPRGIAVRAPRSG